MRYVNDQQIFNIQYKFQVLAIEKRVEILKFTSTLSRFSFLILIAQNLSRYTFIFSKQIKLKRDISINFFMQTNNSRISNFLMQISTSTSQISRFSRSKRNNDIILLSNSLFSKIDDANLIALKLKTNLDDFVSMQREFRKIKRNKSIYENNVNSFLSQNLNVLSIVINFIQVDEQYENTRCNYIKIFIKLRSKISKTKNDNLTQTLNLLKNLK